MGYHWKAYDIWSSKIANDKGFRLDYKYWNPQFRKKFEQLENTGCLSLKSLNTIETVRGISPSSEYYVDEKDGFALVVKAGSNMSTFNDPKIIWRTEILSKKGMCY